MDTISRDSNNSFLPMAGVIAGGLALVLAIVALVKTSSVSKELTDLRGVSSRVDSLEGQVGQLGAAASDAQNAKALAQQLQRDTQSAFQAVANELGNVKGDITKLQAARTAPTPTGAAHTGSGVQATPSGDVYVVKAGDTGTRIAANTGFSVAALEAVNPGIDWRRLRVGQSIKLPKK